MSVRTPEGERPGRKPRRREGAAPAEQPRAERFLDLRSLERTEFNRLIVDQEQKYTLLVTAYQTQWLDHDVAEANTFVVVLPDIIRYGRLLTTGRFREFLELSGSWLETFRAAAVAGVKSGSTPLSALRQEFWTVARGLMHYDITLISGWFKGRALLHPYLSDLALSLGRREIFDAWLNTEAASLLECRRGIWTQQAPMALSLFSDWSISPDAVLYQSSDLDQDTELAVETAAEGPFYKQTEFLRL
jgi:hypothetical protein